MSDMRNLFRSLDLDPEKWLAFEREREAPTNNDAWSGIANVLGCDRATSISVKRAIETCAIRFDSEIIPEGTEVRMLLDMLRGEVGRYVVDESQVLLVRAEKYCVLGFTFDISSGEVNLSELGLSTYYALLMSWEKNPNREHAHMARNFLCDEVEQMLKDEAMVREHLAQR